MPLGFIPDYSLHEVPADAFPYTFKYRVFIESASRLRSVIVPENASVTEKSDDLKKVVVECDRRSSQVKLFWRSQEMLKPQLLYAEHPKEDQVAVLASLVPTFEPPAPQEELEVLEDEEPEMPCIEIAKNTHFIFIIDRSGSMSGSRIAQAKAALRIFLKSLPPDCIFSVIGFGSSYNFIKGPNK